MSTSISIKYQPLSQTAPSDDEDEGFHDNILFDSRLVSGPDMGRRNVFELERLGQPRIRSPVSIQYLGRGRRVCVLATVLLVILLGVVVAVLFPILSHVYNHGIVTDIHTGKTSLDWTLVFNNTWMETNVRLIDVDGDGLDDILIGLAVQGGTDPMSDPDRLGTTRECCSSQDSQYPYGGHIVALRGYDGKEIWRSATRSMVLYQNCMDIDVNGDGRMDCIITGRDSTCQAVDVKTGEILWVIDPDSSPWSSQFISGWHIYGAVSLPDLDSDGVLDLLVLHGEGSDKLASEHGRRPSCLILLSGKTGLVIGKSCNEFPEAEDSFMSLVKYVTHDKAVYVLFGSGGDNSAGKLMTMSLPDVYHMATGEALANLDLSIYTWLEGTEKDDNGAAVLFRGQSKGTVITPVLVDTDKDGYMDLFVCSSDGSAALLDGKTLQQRWGKNFDGMGIYSTPTPGFFDTDSVLDFMIHLSKGTCNSFNISQTLVMSGVDGETLWSFQAENYTLSSGLSLETAAEGLSIFMVTVRDVHKTHALLPSGLDIQVHEEEADSENVQSAEEFQNFCSDIRRKVASNHVTCDHDLEFLTEKVFLLDSIINDQPLRLLERKAFRYNYTLQHAPGGLHCHNMSDAHKDKIDMCAVLVPTSYTGAVGDVDADGLLDYIHVTQMVGLNRSDTLDVTGSIGSIIISKHNINSAIARGEFLRLNLVSDIVPNQPKSGYQQHIQSWKFSQSSAHSLTHYLGSNMRRLC